MSLITRPPSLMQSTSNMTGTPGLTPGTLLTAGAANVDGSIVSLLAALAHDVHLLQIGFNSAQATSTNTAVLCDIFVDPAGGTAWETNPRISDLITGYVTAPSMSGALIAGAMSRSYFFPLFIPSGASIGARIRSATASQTIRAVLNVSGRQAHPENWVGQSVTEIGITAASSIGTAHTGGSTGAYSAWTNFGSTLSRPCGALQFAVGAGGIAGLTALQYYYEFGVGSNRIGPPIHVMINSSEALLMSPSLVPCALPAGTQLQVRATCSGAAQALDVAAYAVH